jgi:hypothetical protein
MNRVQKLSDIRSKYEAYLGWLEVPQVFCLRFEDLILERDQALGRILDYLAGRGFEPQVNRSQAIETLKQGDPAEEVGHLPQGQAWQLARTFFAGKY